MKIVKNIATNTAIKCPYDMKPTRIIVHNTANDASAKNEIAYMVRNNSKVSFHYAVDDIEAVQGIEENRNSWNAGDGANGKGNREGIAIEICYSKSGGDRFIKSEKNAVKLIVDILKRYGWGIDKVTKHQDYSKKNCPHRTLELGWDRFIKMIQEEIAPVKVVNTPYNYKVKKGDSLSVIGKNLGINWQDIAKLNNISSPYVIHSGQTIKLPTNTVKPVVKPVAKPMPIKVGDFVKPTGRKYITGQNIPIWVKIKKYKVIQIKGNKLLLGGIMSWVFANEVKR